MSVRRESSGNGSNVVLTDSTNVQVGLRARELGRRRLGISASEDWSPNVSKNESIEKQL